MKQQIDVQVLDLSHKDYHATLKNCLFLTLPDSKYFTISVALIVLSARLQYNKKISSNKNLT